MPAGLTLGKVTVNGTGTVTVAFLCRVPPGTRQSLCRVPDKIHSTKSALSINFLPCVLCQVPHSAKALPSENLNPVVLVGCWNMDACHMHALFYISTSTVPNYASLSFFSFFVILIELRKIYKICKFFHK